MVCVEGLYQGDCLEWMRQLPDACVDAIVTDPPYGLGFMGEGWDRGVPGEVYWGEALRVCKPGAHLLSFGGTRTYHRLTCAIEDAGWEVRDSLHWVYTQGMPKSVSIKQRPGWGSGLKPAHEPVVLCRKPFKGTIASIVKKYGTGALNIDECRVPHASEEDFQQHNSSVQSLKRKGGLRGSWKNCSDLSGANDARREGRWPPNLLLDRRVAGVLGENVSKVFPLFYCPKPSVAEKEFGLDRLEVKDFGFSEGARGHIARGESDAAATGWNKIVRRRNTHPTVKPLRLLRWLVTLVTPPGGVVIDPFLGSGTTAVAAVELGLRWGGAEVNPEYWSIIEARVAAVERPPYQGVAPTLRRACRRLRRRAEG